MNKDIHRVGTIARESAVHLDTPVQLREIYAVARDIVICHTDTEDITTFHSRFIRL